MPQRSHRRNSGVVESVPVQLTARRSQIPLPQFPLAPLYFDGQQAQLRLRGHRRLNLGVFRRWFPACDVTGRKENGSAQRWQVCRRKECMHRAKERSRACDVDFLRGAVPIDAAVFLFQQRSVGRFAIICARATSFPAAMPRKVSSMSGAPASAMLSVSSGAVFLWRDVDFLLHEDVAGVHPSIDAHGG